MLNTKKENKWLFKYRSQNQYSWVCLCCISDAASRWAGWALAHPEFGSSVHPIQTREGILYPPHYCLPTRAGFENLAASLYIAPFIWCIIAALM